MATRTKEEVLQLAGQYRERLGPRARDFPISDQWGHIVTTAGLLIRDPEQWQGELTDEIRNGAYYEVIQDWLDMLNKA